MSRDRVELERVESMALQVNRRLHDVESRLEALEQALLEISVTLRQLGEAMSPLKEKELSDAP